MGHQSKAHIRLSEKPREQRTGEAPREARGASSIEEHWAYMCTAPDTQLLANLESSLKQQRCGPLCKRQLGPADAIESAHAASADKS